MHARGLSSTLQLVLLLARLVLSRHWLSYLSKSYSIPRLDSHDKETEWEGREGREGGKGGKGGKGGEGGREGREGRRRRRKKPNQQVGQSS